MKKTKSTHSGECQLCGRQQKLPKGVMAKHGYTIEWNFFNGTCPGSGELPYELSKELIEQRIPAIALSVKNQEQVIESLKKTPLPADKMMVKLYFGYGTVTGGRRGGYVWVETQVRGDGFEAEVLNPEAYGGQPKWERLSSRDYKKSAQIQCNELWVENLEAGLANTKHYLRFLEQRVKDWKLKELTPNPT